MLQVQTLARHPRRCRDHPQTHPPLPTSDQRKGGAIQPHASRRNGPTPGPTNLEPNAAKHCHDGYTPTITTAATPHSQATHPPAAYLTSRDRTPRSCSS
ncbi:hypothetical protein FHX82_000572 [Amycolatopsis bartoniae]|nr:hypothetical protein [Amycolatopsis bartoniae]